MEILPSFFTVLVFQEHFGDSPPPSCDPQFGNVVHSQFWRTSKQVFRVFLIKAVLFFTPFRLKSFLCQPSHWALIGCWRPWWVLVPHHHVERRPPRPAAEGERPGSPPMCAVTSFFGAAGCWVSVTKRLAAADLSEAGGGMKAPCSLSELSALPHSS